MRHTISEIYLIKPFYQIIHPDSDLKQWGIQALKLIEYAARTCYKSEYKITTDSYLNFVEKIIKIGHLSVIEHINLSVKFIVDRGFLAELTRHRLASYSVESTRYCRYNNNITFIIPPWVNLLPGKYQQSLSGNVHRDGSFLSRNDIDDNTYDWLSSLFSSSLIYNNLLNNNWSPQQARSVLPHALKTEIVCTANLREWRHILALRTSRAAHPQMREIMQPLLKELQNNIPIIFNDIT